MNSLVWEDSTVVCDTVHTGYPSLPCMSVEKDDRGIANPLRALTGFDNTEKLLASTFCKGHFENHFGHYFHKFLEGNFVKKG